MPGSGNGEKSKTIYGLLTILLGILSWLGSGVYTRVFDVEKRVTVLETNYANINQSLSEIRDILVAGNTKRRGRSSRNASTADE